MSYARLRAVAQAAADQRRYRERGSVPFLTLLEKAALDAVAAANKAEFAARIETNEARLRAAKKLARTKLLASLD